ncbi:MAG: hypothetical protein CR989_05065 [Flavobacteriales bacterium]|nr:MAG: hypothetical protein CR989_05065 [Flavobacteriales bacterium]
MKKYQDISKVFKCKDEVLYTFVVKTFFSILLENFIKFLIKNKESCGHNINRTQVFINLLWKSWE